MIMASKKKLEQADFRFSVVELLNVRYIFKQKTIQIQLNKKVKKIKDS